MLTNALGIGQECKVSTFVVPLADGDRFLLCSDGISEYVPENEVGEVLTDAAEPGARGAAARRARARARRRRQRDRARRARARGRRDARCRPSSAARRRGDQRVPAVGARSTPQQRLRALRIAIPRDHAAARSCRAHTLGDRVAWIVVEGELEQDGEPLGPGSLVYPESLLARLARCPTSDGLAVAQHRRPRARDPRRRLPRAVRRRSRARRGAARDARHARRVQARSSAGHARRRWADTEVERAPSNSDVTSIRRRR